MVGVLEFFFGNHEKVIPELGWGEKNQSFTLSEKLSKETLIKHR